MHGLDLCLVAAVLCLQLYDLGTEGLPLCLRGVKLVVDTVYLLLVFLLLLYHPPRNTGLIDICVDFRLSYGPRHVKRDLRTFQIQ